MKDASVRMDLKALTKSPFAPFVTFKEMPFLVGV
jgi:hypothetical protein